MEAANSDGKRDDLSHDSKAKEISSLNVKEVCNKNTKLRPTFSQPIEICSFGVDDSKNTLFGGKDMLRKFQFPSLPCNLNEGYKQYIEKSEDPGDLTRIVNALKEANISLSEIQVVSFRNNFNKILETPYSNNIWHINIRKVKGTMYFDIVMQKQQESEEQKLASYWGYKFEQMCTQPLKDQASDSPVNPNVEFCTVVKLKLNNHRIILGAEIDCAEEFSHSTKSSVLPHKRDIEEANSADKAEQSGKQIDQESNQSIEAPILTLDNYVELKTYKLLDSEKAKYTWKRYKLLRFWIQSFLVGVPRIVCGFRDNEGVVRNIQRIKTTDIPKMAQDLWNPWICLTFADQLIHWLNYHVKEGNRYILSFIPPFTHVKLFLA